MKSRVAGWAGSVDSFSLGQLANTAADRKRLSASEMRIEFARNAVVFDIRTCPSQEQRLSSRRDERRGHL